MDGREALDDFLEAVPDGVIVCGEDGRIVFANRQAEILSRYTREELISRSIEDLVPARLRANHLRNRAGYLGDPVTRPMGTQLDIRLLRKDGTEFPADIALGPIKSEAGFLVVATIRDVSERRRIDAELRKARELQQLVRERQRIGRELHDGSIQMLFALGMKLQALSMQMTDRPLAAQLDETVTDIDEIIRDLRNYIFELRPALLSSRTLAESLRELAADLERETGIATAVDAGSGVEGAGLSGRSGDLVQLAREALSNVGRHAQAQTCRVSLRREDDLLRLEIHDDGRGFDPGRVAGTGWGLSNMKERASALGGTIEIDTAPGRGTTLRVTVPCDESAAGPG